MIDKLSPEKLRRRKLLPLLFNTALHLNKSNLTNFEFLVLKKKPKISYMKYFPRNALDFNDYTLSDGKHLHLPKKNAF